MGSSKTFLVPVTDRTVDTLVTIIKNWIEPGTRIISDCWAAYRTRSDEGYEHQTVNHSISFVNEETGAHTNTIEFTWRQVKATLPPYDRQAYYIYALSEHMFRKKCIGENCDPFSKFVNIVSATGWDGFNDM